MSISMRSFQVAGLVALATFAAAQAGAASNRTADGKPDFGGVWLVEKPQKEVKTTAGKAPPLKAEAAAEFAKRKQAVASGKDADDPVALCLPHGVPRLLNAPRPIHILQKPKQITVLYEANHQARMFYIDEPLPKADAMPDPTFNGASVARWSGDALIVDTVAMNDQTWLDEVGLPHSEALKVTERYELSGPDRLKVSLTITDPATFTAPWEMQVMYRKQPGLRFKEDACSEKFWHPGKDSSS
jgi:hypothetical protein